LHFTKPFVMSEIKTIMQKASKKGTLAGLRHSEVSQIITGMESQIAQALPAHLSAKRIIQTVANIVAKNPKIAECSAASILGAVMESALLGLSPGLRQCYFVPYGQACQFQIGYQGWVELARRSGKIKTLYAYTVHKGDEFEYELGLNPKLVHKPAEVRGEITHVYAVAHYLPEGYSFVVLTKSEVEALRRRNASQRESPAGPWATDYAEMAKAKAIKRLAKLMPLSDELARATLADEAIITEQAISNDGSGNDVEGFVYDIEIPEA
jgi:recombination protein RecT